MNHTFSLHGFSSSWGKDFAQLGLRWFIAYEFWEAGIEKWRGENWFMDIQDAFPFPFHLFSAHTNWVMAMGIELIVPVLLVVGLLGRLGAALLMLLTIVAWAAVHSGHGYNVCDNGYKMALIYLIMLLPLVLQGMGRLSFDHLLQRYYLHHK